VGRAFIMLKPGAALSVDEIRAHCRARLAGYKVPATIIITASIPQTGSGKVQKHLLPRDDAGLQQG
jgi:fatty-acyl-CoA synthase